LLPGIADYLLWYAKDKGQLKYRQPHRVKADQGEGADEYKYILLPDGTSRSITSAELENPSLLPKGAERYRPSATTSQRPPGSDPFDFQGKVYTPSKAQFWKTSVEGLRRLGRAGRIIPRAESVSYLRKLTDFPIQPTTNVWDDTRWGFDASEKLYVVQT